LRSNQPPASACRAGPSTRPALPWSSRRTGVTIPAWVSAPRPSPRPCSRSCSWTMRFDTVHRMQTYIGLHQSSLHRRRPMPPGALPPYRTQPKAVPIPGQTRL